MIYIVVCDSKSNTKPPYYIEPSIEPLAYLAFTSLSVSSALRRHRTLEKALIHK